jgi:glutathione S-transferase
MIRLHTLPGLDRAPSLSPFCMKVDVYLRMTEMPYETVTTLDASRGPKAKLPYVEIDGERLGDSYFIFERLVRDGGRSLDAHLTPRERATALAFTRMLDEHVYWAIVHSRWFDERFSKRMIDTFLGALPAAQRTAVGEGVVHAISQMLHAHGMGRHTPSEIADRAIADLGALSDLLGDQAFMLGDHPTSFDATAFAFLSNILDVDMDTALRRFCLSRANLVEYCARMRDRYYA